MTLPLMPKATAVWLVEHTALTFEQIADFCGMHSLEVQSIADGEVATSIIGLDPTQSGQITQADIERCEKNPKERLTLSAEVTKFVKKQSKAKGGRYTPVSRRQDKPDAIAWLIKNYPAMTDAQLVKLVGTTKSTIASVRDKSHWNTQNIKPRDPVLLGLCSQTHLDAAVAAIKPSANAAKG